jgi:alpha-tubulin suppressor-like RCC1 family protein
MSYIYYSVGGKLAVSNGKALRTFVTDYPLLAGRENGVQLLKTDGRMWGWGYSQYGEIGNNSISDRSTPVSVCGVVKTFCKIGAGYYASYGIDQYGKAWGWGYGGYGELGNASLASFSTPVSIGGANKTFCQIVGGNLFALAIDLRGKTWGWGYNLNGGLGTNSSLSSTTPRSVCGAAKTFCKVSGGARHSLALTQNGRAWAWGSNLSGGLGNNTLLAALTPVSVCGDVQTFCHIVASQDNSYAINEDGRAFSWGSNSFGALGDNTTTNRCTPVRVGGAVKTFCQIASGFLFVGAIDKYGQVWTWGTAASGVLGNNSNVSRSTPVSICGAKKTFCGIFAGNYALYAVDKNGNVWAWGSNLNGQLGDNTNTAKSTPVRVCGL